MPQFTLPSECGVTTSALGVPRKTSARRAWPLSHELSNRWLTWESEVAFGPEVSECGGNSRYSTI